MWCVCSSVDDEEWWSTDDGAPADPRTGVLGAEFWNAPSVLTRPGSEREKMTDRGARSVRRVSAAQHAAVRRSAATDRERGSVGAALVGAG